MIFYLSTFWFQMQGFMVSGTRVIWFQPQSIAPLKLKCYHSRTAPDLVKQAVVYPVLHLAYWADWLQKSLGYWTFLAQEIKI